METLNPQEKASSIESLGSDSEKIPNTEPELKDQKYDDLGRKLNAAGNRRGMASGKATDKKTEEEKPIEPFSFLDKETINAIVKFPFQFYAATSSNMKWILTSEESEQVVLAIDKVLSKYVPNALNRFGEETEVIFFVALLIIKKMGQDDKIIKKPKNKNESPDSKIFDFSGQEVIIDKTDPNNNEQ